MERIDGLDKEVYSQTMSIPSLVALPNQAPLLQCLGRIAAFGADRSNAQRQLESLKEGKPRSILHGTNEVALFSLLQRDHRGPLEHKTN